MDLCVNEEGGAIWRFGYAAARAGVKDAGVRGYCPAKRPSGIPLRLPARRAAAQRGRGPYCAAEIMKQLSVIKETSHKDSGYVENPPLVG